MTQEGVSLAGDAKVDEYVKRAEAGESLEKILEGLPNSFQNAIKEKLGLGAGNPEIQQEDIIPPQYKGLSSKIVADLWVVPQFLDPQKTQREHERRERALAAIRDQERLRAQVKARKEIDAERIHEIEKDLGIISEPTPQQHKEKLYSEMSFEELEADAIGSIILQEQALKALQEDGAAYFNREFLPNLDKEGYLLKKDGTSSNLKPSQLISGGKLMKKVLKRTHEWFLSRR